MTKVPRGRACKLHKFGPCGQPRSFYRMNFQRQLQLLLLVVSLASVNATGYIPNGNGHVILDSNGRLFPSPTRRSTSVNPVGIPSIKDTRRPE